MAEFARGVSVVIADMTATTLCDTLGTRALVLACHQTTELPLLLPCPEIMRVWQSLGVDAALPIYHSRDEAVHGV